MIIRKDWTIRLTLLAIAMFLGIIALRPVLDPAERVFAQASRFDHVLIVSMSYLHKGSQGLLVMDKRNGNVWFIPRQTDSNHNPSYSAPVFIVRVPFEKLDQAPQ